MQEVGSTCCQRQHPQQLLQWRLRLPEVGSIHSIAHRAGKHDAMKKLPVVGIAGIIVSSLALTLAGWLTLLLVVFSFRSSPED